MDTLPFQLIPARIHSAEKAAHFNARPAVLSAQSWTQGDSFQDLQLLRRTPERTE